MASKRRQEEHCEPAWAADHSLSLIGARWAGRIIIPARKCSLAGDDRHVSVDTPHPITNIYTIPTVAAPVNPGKSASVRVAPRCVAHDLREHRAEVGREREIASFVQLLRREARPLSVHLVPLHVTADHEQRARVTVVRSAVAILLRHAPELRHRHDDDVVHPVAEVGDERGDRLREVVEAVRELPGRAALIHVRVPAADIGERDLESDVRLDELRDLPQALPERRPRILRSCSAAYCCGFAALSIFTASNISAPAP